MYRGGVDAKHGGELLHADVEGLVKLVEILLLKIFGEGGEFFPLHGFPHFVRHNLSV